MIFQLPYVESMKREGIIQQMKKEARAIPVRASPLKAEKPAIALLGMK